MKRSTEKEMMDLPGNPKELLVADLRNLRIINRYLGGYRGVMKSLKQLVRKDRMSRFSLLDVGTGSADIPRVIVRWARKQCIEARIVALEPEPVTAAEAAHQTRQWPEITVIRGDGLMPPFQAASFDFVLASQVLHHFSDEKITALLKTWSRLARKAILISDLVRDPLAYYGIRVITYLFTRNQMTRFDGPLSVRRALTLNEWRELFREAGVGRFRIIPIFPYRQLTVISVSR
jgi:ubiquinone/menaquinone biosynthesis C-methylase UbiE